MTFLFTWQLGHSLFKLISIINTTENHHWVKNFEKTRKIHQCTANVKSSKMNNTTETEQERQYRKNKNEIVGMIFLNICPVYAGKNDKISIRSSLRKIPEKLNQSK